MIFNTSFTWILLFFIKGKIEKKASENFTKKYVRKTWTCRKYVWKFRGPWLLYLKTKATRTKKFREASLVLIDSAHSVFRCVPMHFNCIASIRDGIVFRRPELVLSEVLFVQNEFSCDGKFFFRIISLVWIHENRQIAYSNNSK